MSINRGSILDLNLIDRGVTFWKVTCLLHIENLFDRTDRVYS